MSSWHSYPKIYALGHKAIAQLFFDPVVVEEKIDGSQLSFGVIDGQLKVKSHHHELILDAPEKMFVKAIEVCKRLAPKLNDGWTYRGEYLNRPKHNCLSYDRAPDNNIILFDINIEQEDYLNHEAKKGEAERLGLECVPRLLDGDKITQETLQELLKKESCLGGTTIEGVVLKNYERFGKDGHCLMGKYVSEAFKEKAGSGWRIRNPAKKDVLQTIIETLKTEARWNKAVQHVREAGELEDDPRDIGKLMKAVHKDIDEEEVERIAQALVKWALPKVKRGVAAGLPEWYKMKLMEKQFNNESTKED